jgi:DNA-directed RNA polymerase subunit alpha
MIQEPKKFVSYIESRIEDNNNLYARFHLGSFIGGQALTIANALRRTLLAEIPAFVITRIEIDGVNHEFATLPGIQESILNIVLNLKKIVLVGKNVNLFSPPIREFKASLNIRGPGVVTAQDIKFPIELASLVPSHYIATLGSTGELKLNLTIQYCDPLVSKAHPKENLIKLSQELLLDTIPKPVKQVNFSIHQMPTQASDEYISLEIWTDGSISPKEALGYSLEKLTRIFYDFTRFNQNSSNSLF